MQISFDGLSPNERYHIMTQVIVPRPIAWVLSDNGGGDYNLAPFSYFNAVSSEPPLVMISVGHKPDGQEKDTRVNIRSRKNLVIHIPRASQAQAVTASAATMAHGESEIDALGLDLTDVQGWALPRLADCQVAMACHFYQLLEIGPQKQALFLCEVDGIYIRDEAVTNDAKGRPKIDAAAVDPLSRLGASEYARFGEVFSLARPK